MQYKYTINKKYNKFILKKKKTDRHRGEKAYIHAYIICLLFVFF